MKGLRLVLTPFAPDQSGATGVLYDMGGIIIICDAGGCAGNICGFDEPRWSNHRSAIFSAGLRDMDAILGRDDRLVEKLSMAAKDIEANFVAVIGTPVPAVIATDYKALERMAEKKTGLPVITVEANGMRTYDRGEEEAYLALFKKFVKDKDSINVKEKRVGVLGAVPMELGSVAEKDMIVNNLKAEGYEEVITYGFGATFEDVLRAGDASLNIAVSPAGIKTAKYLKDTYGTPYEIRMPLGRSIADGIDVKNKKVLVVHQQVYANAVRDKLLEKGALSVDVGSYFMMDKELSAEADVRLEEEDDFVVLTTNGKYDIIMADGILKPLIKDFGGDFVNLPHFALSGKQEVV